MRVASGVITAGTLSDAWLDTLVHVSAAPDRKLFQTVTRIEEPNLEDVAVRGAADQLLASLDYQPVETVANTLFPLRLAQSSEDVHRLGQRYRDMYSVIRRVHRSNRRGTYFGRLVQYPAENGPHDQLVALIGKLEQELSGDRPKGARYEVTIAGGLEHAADADSGDAAAGSEVAATVENAPDDGAVTPIQVAARDTSPMDFPCLSLCSFHLDHHQLHLTAHYRSQYLVQRGYGNYLGLARLQQYVANALTKDNRQVGTGQLLIVAGLAHADAAKYRIERVVAATSKRSGVREVQ